jgi:hypothetical protein
MEPTTEILREELLAAREKVRTQIDRLRARPYPVAAIGPIGTVIDNDALIARLTETLRQIEEFLAGLRWDEA